MTTTLHLHSRPRPLFLAIGFVYMYFAWGATYLAVKWSLLSIPPYVLSSWRFSVAGGLLLLFIACFDTKNFRVGTWREWRDATFVGGLLLGLGIGTGNWAQQYVTSSFTALVFGSVPLWIALIDGLRPGGSAPTRTVVLGLSLGFFGVCVILMPTHAADFHWASLSVNLILLAGSVCWAAGSVASRLVHAQGSPLLPMARQMIMAAALLSGVAYLRGEWPHVSFAHMATKSVIGYGYLVVIGSLSGYTVYIWLMRSCAPTKVATITYVNLIVAVTLGWWVGHEAITPRLLVGAVIIIGSVALVLKSKPKEIPATGD